MTQNIKMENTIPTSMWPFKDLKKQKQYSLIILVSGLTLIAFYLVSPTHDILYFIGIPLGAFGLLYFSEAVSNAPI